MENPASNDLSRPMDGSQPASKMRAHRGNMPTTLPQDKQCSICTAKFTRTTHLNRHMKNHQAKRDFQCDTCPAQFTRSDLLARHRRGCDPSQPGRLRSCVACTEQKVKCDRAPDGCSRCRTRGRPCVFSNGPRKKNSRVVEVTEPAEPEPTAWASPSSQSPSSTVVSPLSDNTTKVDIISDIVASLPTDDLRSLEGLDRELERQGSLVMRAQSFAGSPAIPAIYSHLAPYYKDDFQPFFSDMFNPAQIWITNDDFPLQLPTLQEIPRQGSMASTPWLHALVCHGDAPAEGKAREQMVNDFFNLELKLADPRHYVYLFFNAFQIQIPIVHGPTFNFNEQPVYLIKGMKACGALFVKTRKAANYIREALVAVQEGLEVAFAKASIDHVEQIHLVITVVLLQTIGIFHERLEERAKAQSYHHRVVAMIRRTGLMARMREWKPPATGDVWKDWSLYETGKRALLLSYLHDCCQSIYFGQSPSYLPGESPDEWLSALQTVENSLPIQSPHDCVAGQPLVAVLDKMTNPNPDYLPSPNLSPFSHFVLIHAILRDLFTACQPDAPNPFDDGDDDDEPNSKILVAQHAMHNWLHSWITSPFVLNRPPTNEEPTFVENALPFWWLGQVAILAHQESLAPFDRQTTGEMQFRVVKRWLRRIRTFLAEGDNNDNEATIFWDDLMKLRLQSWQLELDSDGGGDDDGLLGFFPATV
ncbi:Fungal-trans domain-containing protein [Mycena kentingensis (nom. inval.)]|nr:Fungal-trans domain-containing protein [Mycena kentingensis (nom. inval.)]